VKRNITQYGGNPERIFVVGHSAGAYNAVMVFALSKVKASDVRGVIGLAGPYDFLPLTDPKLQAIFAPAKPLKTMLPIHYAAQKFPPLLLMTGDKDTDVSPKNTRNLTAALKASGNNVQAIYLPELDHIDIVTALATPLENKSVLEPLFAFIKTQ
jgi:acetyl esterase/lipase